MVKWVEGLLNRGVGACRGRRRSPLGEPRRALTIVHKAPGPHQDSWTADVDESMRWKSGTGKASAAPAGARGDDAYS